MVVRVTDVVVVVVAGDDVVRAELLARVEGAGLRQVVLVVAQLVRADAAERRRVVPRAVLDVLQERAPDDVRVRGTGSVEREITLAVLRVEEQIRGQRSGVVSGVELLGLSARVEAGEIHDAELGAVDVRLVDLLVRAGEGVLRRDRERQLALPALFLGTADVRDLRDDRLVPTLVRAVVVPETAEKPQVILGKRSAQ